MYNRFFGFKERPFKLVPNPAYVYLSRIHEEALAHLNYAVSHGDGFVSVTGEVGTGKTTLCRMFLDSLDETTEVAYIFNPKLDVLQLLKTINDEFRIASDTESLKSLIDALNVFLLEKKSEDRQVLLLVDEAQNLSADVLEQLRLLSNLETNTSKLLQIILVGQPELEELLETDKLRQLKQRITLSCRLTPLSADETQEYIRHRLHIASSRPGVTFSTAACRLVYKHSGGVPRLINITCDRALLIAFTNGKQRIGGDVVKRAIRELEGKKKQPRSASIWKKVAVGLTALVVISAAAVTALQLYSRYTAEPVASVADQPIVEETLPAVKPAAPAASASVQPAPQAQADLQPAPPLRMPEPPPRIELADSPEVQATPEPPAVNDLRRMVLSMEDASLSRRQALEAALKVWNAPISREEILSLAALDDNAFFRAGASGGGLETLRLKGEVNDLKKLDLPAILEFQWPRGGGPRFLTLVELTDEQAVFANNQTTVAVPVGEMVGLWRGVAYIPWKDFYNLEGVIPVASTRETVLSLKMYLRTLGFPITDTSASFDAVTREAIDTIQTRHGLDADGRVGPLTKIVLYNDNRTLKIPHLRPNFGG